MDDSLNDGKVVEHAKAEIEITVVTIVAEAVEPAAAVVTEIPKPKKRGRTIGSKNIITEDGSLTEGQIVYARMKKYQKSYQTNRRSKEPEHYLLYRARGRTNQYNLPPCTITLDDIIIPEFCPILGIPIIAQAGHGYKTKDIDNSPSLDQIIPGKGYTPENCIVISMRANRLKNNGTAKEALAISEWQSKYEDPNFLTRADLLKIIEQQRAEIKTKDTLSVLYRTLLLTHGPRQVKEILALTP